MRSMPVALSERARRIYPWRRVASGRAVRTSSAPWARRAEDGLSVLRLALDTTDPVQRSRLESMFSAAYSVRRAVQRDARARTRAYWAAPHERARGSGGRTRTARACRATRSSTPPTPTSTRRRTCGGS